MHRKIFYFLMILALSSTLVMAQKGKIKGKVTDMQTGDVLIGATVAIVGTSYGAQTGADGDYLIQNLDAGDYDLKVSYIGYKTITFKGIRVNSGQDAYESFKLPSDEITVNTVEVVAERKLIQKSEAATNTIKTADDIKSLPTRNINTIINLTAGVANVQGVTTSFRGGRGNQTSFYLEGVQNTNPFSMAQNVGVSIDALEESSVQTGGMTAEYGNANSGAVRQTLRSGGSTFRASIEYITDNITFMSLEDMYNGKKALGAHPTGYNETSLTLSGPILTNDVRFFTNLNYSVDRNGGNGPTGGQLPEEPYNFGLVFYEATAANQRDTVPLAWNAGAGMRKNMWQNLTSTTTLNLDLSKEFLVRLTGILQYNWSNTTASGFGSRFNSRGNDFQFWSQAYTARLTHILSTSMFYEINLAYNTNHQVNRDPYLGEQYELYGDSVANANAGAIWTRSSQDVALGWTGRFRGPRQYGVWNQAWNKDYTVSTAYGIQSNWGFSASGTLNLNIGKEHSIRLGGEYRTYQNRNWTPPTQNNFATLLNNAVLNEPGTDVEVLKARIRANQYFGGRGYDANGNEATDDFNGAYTPVLASAFINDAIEYEDLIINVGLRYDYIDPNSMKLVDPSNPQLGADLSGDVMAINPAGWTKVTPSSTVSPRISVIFPVTEKTRFRASYGNYVQMDRLNIMYQQTPLNFIRQLQSGFFQTYGALDMRPTRTTSYEVGIEQEITDFLAIQVTGYYKDIKDELTNVRQNVSRECPWGSYITYANGDFATTKGIDLNINMRRYQRLLINGSFSYSDARGTGSNQNSNLGIIGAPIEGQLFVPQYIAPLQFNVPIKATLNFDYRFGLDEGGPVLSGLSFSLLMQYQNGHPYTRGYGSSAQLGDSRANTGDARSRTALEPLNASYTPNLITADARIDKQFRIFDKLLGTVYLRIANVFNIRNVQNVYVKSGSAYDDGYLSDPTESGQQRAQYGETWYNWQKHLLDYQNGFIDQPRTFILGIRLDY